ncbi:hypothetical protein BCR37DRAFT_167925 [Protomyces lactucae-debilis]|uniref:Uncharacterized protein n=1 Tax=Protomyces lactucae-debilis TaxID=2754530 RepID=A0A1Y2EZ98_PROLT|nr:uncharacterized protein BCR37DRAFT_167925 [Protomyces lactucae-debilis]ORY76065.1 hypothetical protein BCR37DRAFT_167925 [Protomyces lactucae-debilis]
MKKPIGLQVVRASHCSKDSAHLHYFWQMQVQSTAPVGRPHCSVPTGVEPFVFRHLEILPILKRHHESSEHPGPRLAPSSVSIASHERRTVSSVTVTAAACPSRTNQDAVMIKGRATIS